MMTRRRTEHETNGIFRGRGMIVPITPDGAVLKPFGTKRFSLVCKNNMCGEYMDKLHLQVGGLPRITFPVRVGVVGTPLHLQNERALIRGFSQGYNVARLRKDFGQILVGGTLEKTFHVFNLGSVDMDLEWEVLVCDDAEPCVDVTLRPGTSVVSVSVDAKGYPKEGLFEITPKRKMMAAGSSAQFRVRYDASTPEECTAYLVGTQTVKGTQEDVPIRLKMCETGNEAKPIACILSDGFHPHAAAPPVPLYPIRVDLKAATICPHLEPDPQTDASLLIHSTFPPKTHPSYIKTVTYCNKLGSPLTFSISCGDGPFEFMAAAPSVPQDIQDFQGLTGAPKTLENGFILVPPKESVEVTVRLQPPKRWERTDYDLDGALTFHYNNGIEQIVPLHASILHPEIKSNVVELDFGAVHVSSPKTLHITVSNPSLVDATWTIVQDDQKPDFTKSNQKSAQFGVFSIEPCGGNLNGRGLLMPRTARVSITLSPTDMDGYEERVRFVCRRGRGCEVVLKGWGTFDERGEHKKELYRI
ncbi:hypothetical protein BSKO_12400 [Bryopsis sp. KO-2023]|nr:hypothetical protein BSKO_12400 [Bryopsis sp. KO-2023]